MTTDPATEQEITNVAHGEAEDIDRAVAAARRAFEEGPWRTITPSARGQIIWRLADLLEKHADEFAELEALDNGKPLSVARTADVPLAVDLFRYMAGWATKIEGNTIPISVPGTFAYTLMEPVGVVGQIIPWNFPLLMAAWKLGPALATGCTVVLKPAEQTPLSALRLGELFQEAGLPDGVLNIVTGFGDAGARLAAHPGVDKVAFTGSTEVGKLVVQAAAGNLKKVSLELGGKAPLVIYRDADIEKAIANAATAAFFNHGQCCTSGSRLYVEHDIYDDVVTGIAEQAKKIKVAPAFDPGSQMGPLISGEQFERVSGYLAAGFADGADCPGRRRTARRQGLLHRADGAHERQPGHDDRPRGNIRPRPSGDGVRRPAGDRGSGQRHELRPGRGRVDKRHLEGPQDRRAGPGRHGLGQHLPRLRRGAAVRRLQGIRLGPRDGPPGVQQLPGKQVRRRRPVSR